jgi:hypothetical protein
MIGRMLAGCFPKAANPAGEQRQDAGIHKSRARPAHADVVGDQGIARGHDRHEPAQDLLRGRDSKPEDDKGHSAGGHGAQDCQVRDRTRGRRGPSVSRATSFSSAMTSSAVQCRAWHVWSMLVIRFDGSWVFPFSSSALFRHCAGYLGET